MDEDEFSSDDERLLAWDAEGWDLESLHEKSLANKAALAASPLAGCFSCLRTFPPSAIVQWVRSGARRDVELTCAACPFCSVDAVLASSDSDLTDELLGAMNRRWFPAPND